MIEFADLSWRHASASVGPFPFPASRSLMILPPSGEDPDGRYSFSACIRLFLFVLTFLPYPLSYESPVTRFVPESLQFRCTGLLQVFFALLQPFSLFFGRIDFRGPELSLFPHFIREGGRGFVTWTFQAILRRGSSLNSLFFFFSFMHYYSPPMLCCSSRHGIMTTSPLITESLSSGPTPSEECVTFPLFQNRSFQFPLVAHFWSSQAFNRYFSALSARPC